MRPVHKERYARDYSPQGRWAQKVEPSPPNLLPFAEFTLSEANGLRAGSLPQKLEGGACKILRVTVMCGLRTSLLDLTPLMGRFVQLLDFFEQGIETRNYHAIRVRRIRLGVRSLSLSQRTGRSLDLIIPRGMRSNTLIRGFWAPYESVMKLFAKSPYTHFWLRKSSTD